jgi:hypothetical protein
VTFKVQAQICATCIYKAGLGWDLHKLEGQVRDKKMRGFFKAYRECHHAKRGSKVCCRGFWNAHMNDFAIGQIAQRLGLVEFVEIDVMKEESNALRAQHHRAGRKDQDGD